ncbi:MAG: hypothetical protein JWL95_923 [Gemmatimonadetes bacterium]|nr:hypothetical protein [Gemmatimonadota bacterium]
MSSARNPTTGAIVALLAAICGVGLAILDMMADNLLLVITLFVTAAFLFGAFAPRWAILAGFCLGLMHPIAQSYVTSFRLRLPHPMHGFYYGVLAIGPAILSAMFAMALRDRIDALRQPRRLPSHEHRNALIGRRRK